MSRLLRLHLLATVLAVSLFPACQQATEPADQTPDQTASQTANRVAVAEMKPTQGNNVQGTVTFEPLSGGQVKVTAHLTGLTPGSHGFHIHENGDCSAPDATSAGGHYNPTGSPHGEPSPEHHMGDLGNVEAGQDGMAHYENTVSFVELEGANSIVGKAVIVHADPDDLKSQPSGNAGARLACGVIQWQQQ